MHVSSHVCSIITQLHYKPHRTHLSLLLPSLIVDKLQQTHQYVIQVTLWSCILNMRFTRKENCTIGLLYGSATVQIIFLCPCFSNQVSMLASHHPSFSRGVTLKPFTMPCHAVPCHSNVRARQILVADFMLPSSYIGHVRPGVAMSAAADGGVHSMFLMAVYLVWVLH